MPGRTATWAFSLRDSNFDDDSDDNGDAFDVDNALSVNEQLQKDIDLTSREDHAKFKSNPWSIAKLNASSRAACAPERPLTPPRNPNTLDAQVVKSSRLAHGKPTFRRRLNSSNTTTHDAPNSVLSSLARPVPSQLPESAQTHVPAVPARRIHTNSCPAVAQLDSCPRDVLDGPRHIELSYISPPPAPKPKAKYVLAEDDLYRESQPFSSVYLADELGPLSATEPSLLCHVPGGVLSSDMRRPAETTDNRDDFIRQSFLPLGLPPNNHSRPSASSPPPTSPVPLLPPPSLPSEAHASPPCLPQGSVVASPRGAEPVCILTDSIANSPFVPATSVDGLTPSQQRLPPVAPNQTLLYSQNNSKFPIARRRGTDFLPHASSSPSGHRPPQNLTTMSRSFLENQAAVARNQSAGLQCHQFHTEVRSTASRCNDIGRPVDNVRLEEDAEWSTLPVRKKQRTAQKVKTTGKFILPLSNVVPKTQAPSVTRTTNTYVPPPPVSAGRRVGADEGPKWKVTRVTMRDPNSEVDRKEGHGRGQPTTGYI